MSSRRLIRVTASATAGIALLAGAFLSSPVATAATPGPTTIPSTSSFSAPDLSHDEIIVPKSHLVSPRSSGMKSLGTARSEAAASTVVKHAVWVSVAAVTSKTSDDQSKPLSAAAIKAGVAAMHDYWWRESGHRVNIVLGGIERISLKKSTCNTNTVLASASTVAFKGAFAKYKWVGKNKHLVVLSREKCGAQAFGTVGADGGEIFSGNGMSASLGVPVLLHEFGHNLGFLHAGSGMCHSTTDFDSTLSNYAYPDDSPTATCPVEAYGDFLDIMGYTMSNARPHLSSVQRILSGYMRDFTTVSTPGTTSTVTVHALGSTTSGQAVRILDPISKTYYYVEYRTRAGADAGSAEFNGHQSTCVDTGSGYSKCSWTSFAKTGAVRVLRAFTPAGGGTQNATAVLAAGTYGTRDAHTRDTHLDAGESFRNYGNGFTVAVVSLSPTNGAVLKITLNSTSQPEPTPAPSQ
ncbi:hypothetical protein [Frondihabitans sp. 4ASC-45]|uniref:hypothetical protein n=1 Tax=Frondihabitans sp. 4ASC-45 TaxID=3111636 RepID=UPI003C2AD33D